jgi:hypothetical protein
MALILALFVRGRRVWQVRSDPTANPVKQRHLVVVPANIVVFASQEAVSNRGIPASVSESTGDDIQQVHISLLDINVVSAPLC